MFKNVNQYSSDAYRSEQAVDLAINKLTLLAEPLQKRVELTQAKPEKWLNLDMLKECQQFDKTQLKKPFDEDEYRNSEMRFDSEVLRLPSFGRFGLLQQLLTLFWGVGKVGTYAFPPLSIFAALGGGNRLFGWRSFLV